MSSESLALFAGYLVGFYMAWNIGANDLANSMASAVGAKAITIRQSIFIAGILNLMGAVFLGSQVTDTIRKGIIDTEIMSDPHMIMVGALSALFAASIWITFATWKSLPVSTTHSIVGAMIGFGLMVGGPEVIKWNTLYAVVGSWIVSPLFSLVLSFVMIKIIIQFITIKEHAFKQAVRLSPVFIGITMFIVVLSFLFKTPLGNSLQLSDSLACIVALLISIIVGKLGTNIILKYVSDNEDGVEEIFRRIQIGTSCYMALAQGANDVANAIAPVAVIYFLVKTGSVGANVPVPFFLLFFGGIGIVAGIAMWGHRVMDTVGNKITNLSNTRGFSVDFAAASTVLLASRLGLPVSTTHAAVGGVIGVGLARGIDAVNFKIIIKIILYWIITVPVSAFTSMAIFAILNFWWHIV